MILVLDIENVPQGWGQWEIDDGHCTIRAGTLMRRYVNCTTSKQYNEGTDFGLHLQMWTQHPNWYMLFFVTLGDCFQRQIWHPQWDWKLTLLFFNRRAILELICMLTVIDSWLLIISSSPMISNGLSGTIVGLDKSDLKHRLQNKRSHWQLRHEKRMCDERDLLLREEGL